MSDKYPRVRVTSANFRDAMYSTRRELPGDEMPFKAVPADAIVIERDELPEVSDPSGRFAKVGDMDTLILSIDDHLAVARRHLAIAEYLDAHPPVDEAQVEALATDLTRAAGADVNPVQVALRLDIARELIRGGWSRSADKHDLEES